GAWGVSGASASAERTTEFAGQLSAANWAVVHRGCGAPAGLATRPAGRVTTDFLIAAWWSGWVTVVTRPGWPPTLAGWPAEPTVAAIFGVNARELQPVAWNAPVA